MKKIFTLILICAFGLCKAQSYDIGMEAYKNMLSKSAGDNRLALETAIDTLTYYYDLSKSLITSEEFRLKQEHDQLNDAKSFHLLRSSEQKQVDIDNANAAIAKSEGRVGDLDRTGTALRDTIQKYKDQLRALH